MRRNIPKLFQSLERYHGSRKRYGKYLGWCLGAQTTAKDSGSMHWKPEWVCKSTEDMKPVGAQEVSGRCHVWRL